MARRKYLRLLGFLALAAGLAALNAFVLPGPRYDQSAAPAYPDLADSKGASLLR